MSEPGGLREKKRRWPIYLLRISAALFLVLALAILAHIAPDCRTGRIVLIADPNTSDKIIRVTVEYKPPDRDFAVREILWEGPPPKSPLALNYMHRSAATFNVYVLDPVTGEWARKKASYIPAIPGNRDVIVVGLDEVALGGSDPPASSETWSLISLAYRVGSDELSCMDAGSAIDRMEEQNRVSARR